MLDALEEAVWSKPRAWRRRGLWRNEAAVEIARSSWVDRSSNRRLLGSIGDNPLAEAEADHCAAQKATPTAA